MRNRSSLRSDKSAYNSSLFTRIGNFSDRIRCVEHERRLSAFLLSVCLLLLATGVPLSQATPVTPPGENASSQATLLVENVVWSEDWESNPDNRWFADAGTWQMGTPNSGPGEAFNGNNVAATVLDGNYGANVDSRLIRIASFTVPASSEYPRLRFWHWYHFGGGDHGHVQISTDGGTTWQTVSPDYSGTSSGVWTRPSLDLRPFAGETAQIAFRIQAGSSFHGPGWYIDDVALVTGLPLLINPEPFESGLRDWVVDHGTWQIGTPSAGPSACHEGTNCAATVVAGNYGPNQNTRLISPPFIVPAASESPNLRFWHWYHFGGGDFGEVEISTDGGGTWGALLDAYSGSSSDTWTQPFADLSPYANQTVQIAFRLASGSSFHGPGWYIDEFSIQCGSEPCTGVQLPVELTDFDAVTNGTEIRLEWKTASETNNAGFEIQHRGQDAPFEVVEFVEGAGTTAEPQRYSYRISDLSLGLHTFRLKQVDFDGAFEYSPEVEVAIEIAEAYQFSAIYPNPFTPQAQFTLTLKEPQQVRVEVFNTLGQRIAVLHNGVLEAATEHHFTLNGISLASGTYMVRATGETFVTTRKATHVK
jgi:hypothetical protein